MRITRLGLGAVLMTGLTWLTAASTGNNLLYLLLSALAAALLLSVVLGRWNLARLSARLESPDQAFRGAPARLRLLIRNDGRRRAFWISAPGAAAPATVLPGEEAELELRERLPHRGLNLLEGLYLESSFPFGLLLHRRTLTGAAVLALPRLREIRAAADTSADARPSGVPTLKKGSGEDLYGVREAVAEDDARLVNWKLSARLGRAVVNEYAEAHDSKVTVRVRGASGAGAEERIEEAASACRFFTDAGAELRLVTPEEDTGYGRGLLHLDRLLRSLAYLGDGKSPRPARAGASAAAAGTDSPALRRLTWLLTVFVYATLYLIDEVNPLLLAAAAPLLLFGLLVQEKGLRVLPDAVWSALSCAVLAYVLVVDWKVFGVVVANTHLLLYLLINRSLIPYKLHEFRQVFLILYLAFFLASGLTISLWYFPCFLLYLALAGAWLSLYSGARWEERRAWAPALSGGLLAGLALSALLFAAVPRVEGMRRFNPFLAAGIDKLSMQKSPLTGFSEGVSLGFFGNLKRSSARVMRVTPPDPVPRGQRAPALYVRGLSFNAFDGRRWKNEPAVFRRRLLSGRFARGERAWAERSGDRLLFPVPARAGAKPYDFWLYPSGLAVVFTVGTPWMLDGISDEVFFELGDNLRMGGAYIGGARYSMHPADASGYGSAIDDYQDHLNARNLRLPPDRRGRVAALSREIVRGARRPRDKARAVVEHLRARYDYSTYMDAKNFSLEHFLFESKKGNCEYFATAGVVLLRHAGVPARLVTGFLAEEWNEYGHFYDVRQREAHAWVEAYLPGQGWVTLDPTPPQGMFSLRAEALARRLGRWFDAVQTQWYRSVVGYDQYTQSNTFRRLGAALNPDLLRRLADLSLRGALLMAVALFLISFVQWAVRRLKAAPPGLFSRAEAALEKAGLKREPHWTAREYAGQVVQSRPDLGDLPELAELHYRERFGKKPLTGEERARAEAILAELRARV